VATVRRTANPDPEQRFATTKSGNKRLAPHQTPEQRGWQGLGTSSASRVKYKTLKKKPTPCAGSSFGDD